MALSKKDEKKIYAANNQDYTDTSWDDDTLIKSYATSQFVVDKQFLDSLINNALSATLSTGIPFIAIQLHGKRISDNDIKDIIHKSISWVTKMLTDTPYQHYMTHKYFGTTEKLYEYIADIITRELYGKALELNHGLDTKILVSQDMNQISELNRKNESKPNN